VALRELLTRAVNRLKAETEAGERFPPGLRCYVKPNRTVPRAFSAQDAARVCCYAVKAGASKAEIDRRFAIVCGDEGRGRPDTAAEAIAVAIEQLQATNLILLDEWRAFLVVNGILIGIIGLLTVLRVVGPLRLVATPLRLGARVAQTQVAQLITINIRGRAANEAVMFQLRETLRRAA
jgi:hypothetical protein